MSKIKWTDIDPKIVLAAAAICDGHSIFKPEAFSDLGVPQELVDRVTEVHESDFSDHKSTISDPDGNPINQLKGIYGLMALTSMVDDFGLNPPSKFGRGSQAAVYREALNNHLKTANV